MISGNDSFMPQPRGSLGTASSSTGGWDASPGDRAAPSGGSGCDCLGSGSLVTLFIV